MSIQGGQAAQIKEYTQDNRVAKLTTPLGADVLLLSRFQAEEELSQVHPIYVEALSTEAELNFDSALGQNCTVTLQTPDKLQRYFCGMLVDAELKGRREYLYVYHLELRPWFWMLNHASSSKIFENQTAPDIIKKVFSDRGFTNFRDALTATYPQLKYCTQYHETDFNFVSRLMEQNGIYYFHEHTDDKHELVLADSKTSHQPAPGVETLSLKSAFRQGAGIGDKQGFYTWSKRRKFTTGKATLDSYDYTQPKSNLKADADKSGSYSNGSLEAYFHQNDYTNAGEGERLAKVVIDARKAADQRRKAKGQTPSLFPGCLVTLTDHADASENVEYLVQHCTHSFTTQAYRTWAGRPGGSLGAAWAGSSSDNSDDDAVDGEYSGAPGFGREYSGSSGMGPSSQQYRAPQSAGSPRAHGADIGIVSGDGEIDTDPDGLGRIQITFPNYDNSANSFWVRPAQFWAGASSRGALFLPRVGDEVVVIFQHGDPSHPIVIGSVYNGNDMPPVSLPGSKNISQIRTLSTTGGGGYHLLSFDDTAGSELMNIQAEKDLTILIKNNETRTVQNDQSETITGNITKSTTGNETEKTTGNVSRTVTGSESVTVTQAYSLTSTTSITLTVGASTISITPSSISMQAPTITITADAMVSINGG